MRCANSTRRAIRAASERGRRWNRIRWSRPYTGTPSAEDERCRALMDARGMVVREGATYHGDGRVTYWQVRRSLAGRTDQWDLVADGRTIATAGQRRLPKCFRP